MDRRVMVIGAGIGGITTALALRRAGIEATVYEKAGEFRHIQVGSGMHLWPNGIAVVRQLEPLLVDELWERGGIEEHMTFIHYRNGRVLFDWPIGEWGRELGGFTVGLRRGDLLAMLASHLDEGAIQFGHQFVECEQDEQGVTARFANGREERGAALIGADGISSAVRARHHDEGTPRYGGYTSWVAFVKFDHEAAPYGRFQQYVGPGKRFIMLHVDKETKGWVAVARAPEGAERSKSERKQDVLEAFGGWREPTEQMIGVTEAAAIGRLDIYDRPPIKGWGEGRVTLVGDAAHPITFNVGQGANQAIEDAFVVARSLQRETDVPQALRAYEAERYKRTAHMQTIAWRIGRAFNWKNPVACSIRNRVVRMVFPGLVAKRQREWMAYQP